MVDLALAHADLIQATHRGFTFLFANGLGWLAVAVAALLGGHFLPYSWLYQTDVYLVLGLVVALTPALLLWLFEERGFLPGPLVVGITLIVAAVILY